MADNDLTSSSTDSLTSRVNETINEQITVFRRHHDLRTAGNVLLTWHLAASKRQQQNRVMEQAAEKHHFRRLFSRVMGGVLDSPSPEGSIGGDVRAETGEAELRERKERKITRDVVHSSADNSPERQPPGFEKRKFESRGPLPPLLEETEILPFPPGQVRDAFSPSVSALSSRVSSPRRRSVHSADEARTDVFERFLASRSKSQEPSGKTPRPTNQIPRGTGLPLADLHAQRDAYDDDFTTDTQPDHLRGKDRDLTGPYPANRPGAKSSFNSRLQHEFERVDQLRDENANGRTNIPWVEPRDMYPVFSSAETTTNMNQHYISFGQQVKFPDTPHAMPNPPQIKSRSDLAYSQSALPQKNDQQPSRKENPRPMYQDSVRPLSPIQNVTFEIDEQKSRAMAVQALSYYHEKLTRNVLQHWRRALRFKICEGRYHDRIQIETLYTWTLSARHQLLQRVHWQRRVRAALHHFVLVHLSRQRTFNALYHPFRYKMDQKLLQKFLDAWRGKAKEQIELDSQACSVHNNHLHRVITPIFKEKCAAITQSNKTAIEALYFLRVSRSLQCLESARKQKRKDKLKEIYSQLRRKHKMTLCTAGLREWRIRLEEVQRDNEIATQHNYNLLQTHLKAWITQWRDRTRSQHEQFTSIGSRLDSYLQIMYIEQLRTQLTHLSESNISAERFAHTHLQRFTRDKLKLFQLKHLEHQAAISKADRMRAWHFRSSTRQCIRRWAVYAMQKKSFDPTTNEQGTTARPSLSQSQPLPSGSSTALEDDAERSFQSAKFLTPRPWAASKVSTTGVPLPVTDRKPTTLRRRLFD